MDKKIIPIVFCLDAAALKYVYAPIQSILRYTRAQIEFWLLLDHNTKPLKISDGCKIQFVEIPEITTYCRGLVKSKAMFYRWLIPDILKDYDKAIYLDFDVILNTDIRKLFNIDLGNYAIGAVKDVYGNTIQKTARSDFQGNVNADEMFMKYNCDISKINYLSGQLLMNLKKWRQENITCRLIDFVIKYKTADMLPLNVILQNDIYELDYKWCAPANTLKENLKSNTPSMIHDDYTAVIGA